jgi:hypothetical protein
VLRSGQAASARVLSSTLRVGRSTGSKYNGAYSIIYEVTPPGGATFRAKATEVMFFSEASANLEAGGTVNVRFDPADHTVVLVRVDPKPVAHQREAERRAREEALLRG